LRAPGQSAATAKPPIDTMVVEIVPVVEKESVLKETARKESIELRLFNPPPPAQAEPLRPVQVAMLEPPKVAGRTSNTVLASNFASKLAPTFSSSSLAAPPPLPLVPSVTSITPLTPAAV